MQANTKIKVDFIIEALPYEQFIKYFSYSKEQLSEIDAFIFEADSNPGSPCRVSLEDAEIGDKVLAICYNHHDVNSPYKGTGPIFIRESVETTQIKINEIPKMLYQRPQSVRAYDKNSMMIKCHVCDGDSISELLSNMFSDEYVEYIHIHNAKPGCFNCVAIRC